MREGLYLGLVEKVGFKASGPQKAHTRDQMEGEGRVTENSV